jgi:RNA polymerase sigma-70 factor (ECF subfamily)
MDADSTAGRLDTLRDTSSSRAAQEQYYVKAVSAHGQALTRIARGYEADPEQRNDLLQEIHIALWRSFAVFDERCSLLTWIYRIAHHTATKHIISSRRIRLNELKTLEELPETHASYDGLLDADHDHSMRRLLNMIERLKPIDRQIILLYLEDVGAEGISEIVGLSPANVAVKIHRIKKLLTMMFHTPRKP